MIEQIKPKEEIASKDSLIEKLEEISTGSSFRPLYLAYELNIFMTQKGMSEEEKRQVSKIIYAQHV